MAADDDVLSRFDEWLAALETRHLADLRPAEVTRGLRALSSAYVERRHKVAQGTALDGAGKRAAFALYYGPLHFLVVQRVVSALGSHRLKRVVDLGCGTGAGGAAWASMSTDPAGVKVVGMDRHPWAVEEARWTYRFFGIDGSARVGDLARLPPASAETAFLAAYVLNELPVASRERLQEALLDGAARGASVLIVEPIARGITPWWDETAACFRRAGARVDEWRFPTILSPALARFSRAAGLRTSELTCRTIAANVAGH